MRYQGYNTWRVEDAEKQDKGEEALDRLRLTAEATQREANIADKIGAITRAKVARQSSSPFEWFYVYSVNGVSIGNSLVEAESWAKRRGLTPMRSWSREAA